MKLHTRIATLLTALVVSVFLARDSRAQCLDWDAAPGPAGVNDFVQTLETLDLGSGPALYIGGSFTAIDGVPANRIARWNGTAVEPLGTGFTGIVDRGGTVTSVHALAMFDDGSGPALFAAGNFATAGGTSASGIAKWNGVAWSALGVGLNRSGDSLAVFDDGSGPALYVGGDFSTAGGVTAWGIARWSGSSWSTVPIASDESSIQELAVFDDGTGMALYAGGTWGRGGSGFIDGIRRWNGTQAAFLRGIPTNGVRKYYSDLFGFDDGTGPALYSCGSAFSQFPPQSWTFFERWNGTSWSSMGFGPVAEIAGFDDGSGPALYAVGSFTQTQGGQPANRIAKWNGTSWSALGSGLGSSGSALAVFDDGTDGAPDLYVGGGFTTAGGQAVDKMAVWRGCPPGTAYCFGDGLDPIVTAACPCSNFGAPGHGCASSTFASGARLIATGAKSPNTILFRMTDVPNNTLATGLRTTANALPGGVAFGDGVRCQSGALIRFGQHDTGSLGDGPNTWSAAPATVAPGLSRYYQVQYRNPSAAFCPPETFNLSNGYRIDW